MDEQKKELFGREDIKTMQKDVASLREQEAEKERERIASLKTAEDTKIERQKVDKIMEEGKLAGIKRDAQDREKAETLKAPWPREKLPPVPKPPAASEVRPTGRPSSPIPSTPVPPGPISPVLSEKRVPLPARPSSSERIFIRVGIIIIIILVFANLFLFWYWYLRGPKVVPPTSEETPGAGETPAPAGSPPEAPTPQAIILPSLIAADATTTLELASPDQLPSVLGEALRTELTEGAIARLLITPTGTFTVLGLKEFLTGLNATVPTELYTKLNNDFTLFVYSQRQGKRLGFVANITAQENLATLLQSWERTMENDLNGLFTVLGKQGPTLSSSFRAVPYKNGFLRYQTFSRDDLGICYTIWQDYLVFTTSWESLLKAVNKLP